MWFGRSKNRRRAAPRQRLARPAWLTWPAWLRLPAVPWRSLMSWLAVAAAVAGVAVVALWLLDQPIQSVSIVGRFERVSPTQVQRAVRESAQGRGLIRVDLHAVRDAVRVLPWVDTVSVQRLFPRALVVSIGEQIAAARWDGGGLLNMRGELFAADPRHTPPELPLLSGPEGSQAQLVQRYLDMRGRLADVGMRITALSLDPRGAWQMDLDNGVLVRLGRKDVDGCFNIFMDTAAKIIAQRPGDIAYVDMRYANGFAIGWRGAAGSAGGGSAPGSGGRSAVAVGAGRAPDRVTGNANAAKGRDGHV
jgi:cell division protein FtsQ